MAFFIYGVVACLGAGQHLYQGFHGDQQKILAQGLDNVKPEG